MVQRPAWSSWFILQRQERKNNKRRPFGPFIQLYVANTIFPSIFFPPFISLSSILLLLFCSPALSLPFLLSFCPKTIVLYLFTIPVLPSSRNFRLLGADLAMNHTKPLSAPWRHNHSSHSFQQVSIFCASLWSPMTA